MSPRKHNWLAVVLITLTVICAASGVVYAHLSTTTPPVDNTFTPEQEMQPSVIETTDSPLKLKENVAVNVGNPGYAVYVRAAIVVTWKDADGNVYAQAPQAGTEYIIDLNDTDWFYNAEDGFYYHKAMINSENSSILIEQCYQNESPYDNYSLSVEIIAQTIQALGSTDGTDIPAVTDAWGVYVDADQQLTATRPTT